MLGLAVVTPWFATPDAPFAGAFVAEWTRSLGLPPNEVLIVHLRSVPLGSPTSPVTREHELARVLEIPVAVSPEWHRARIARLHAEALAKHAPDEYWHAKVVHAHVGLPTGYAVAQNKPRGARLISIEHATFMRKKIRDDEGRAAYRTLLEASDLLLCAGDSEARILRAVFPSERTKIRAVGNPIDTTVFAPNDDHSRRPLDRWLYVGYFVPVKGVDRLINLYSQWRAANGRSFGELVLAGMGPLEEELRGIAASSPYADEIKFVGPLQRVAVARAMREADVLVHLSQHETFGVTVVEAAITGLPVISTRCGGPEETMAVAVESGDALLLAPEAQHGDIDRILDFERNLPESMDSMVLNGLCVKYGASSFGEQLSRMSFGQPEGEGAGSVDRVAVVGTRPGDAERGYGLVRLALDSAGFGTLAVRSALAVGGPDARIDIVDTSPKWALSHLRSVRQWMRLLVHGPVARIRFSHAQRLAADDRRGGPEARRRRREAGRKLDSVRNSFQAQVSVHRDSRALGPLACLALAMKLARNESLRNASRVTWVVLDRRARAVVAVALVLSLKRPTLLRQSERTGTPDRGHALVEAVAGQVSQAALVLTKRPAS
ncbi:glycosyltransferase [Demequina sp. B12]|uniref:glycosyltransferase n=1 Tax=Demequina sp. B12 TaxID=2992757 RepID=UPI0034E05CF5